MVPIQKAIVRILFNIKNPKKIFKSVQANLFTKYMKDMTLKFLQISMWKTLHSLEPSKLATRLIKIHLKIGVSLNPLSIKKSRSLMEYKECLEKY